MSKTLRLNQPRISGDEQERERARLEREVVKTIRDLTFEDTDTHSTEFSVEYPRHRGHDDGMSFSPRADIFPSFALHQHDHSEYNDNDDYNSHNNNDYSASHDFRSLLTADDSVVRLGETFSTTHHHASAVTLGAGLNGPLGRTPSRTGISEFDPERRLPDLLAGRGHSVLDDSVSRSRINSKQSQRKNAMLSFSNAEPLIVEDTAELDRALESGYMELEPPVSAERHRVDIHDRPSSDSEDTSSVTGSAAGGNRVHQRPKLSDTLGAGVGGSFSPQRPKGAQRLVSQSHSNRAANHRPTASTRTVGGASHFSDTARGLAKEIERERQNADRAAADLFSDQRRERDQGPATTSNAARPTTQTSVPVVNVPQPREKVRRPGPSQAFQFPRQGSVHLPDVTGLTSAVGTPNKASRRYRHVKEGVNADASVIRTTIEQLAARLHEVETENITSRRRVRELELDLEKCREDVVRERTRVQIEIHKQLQFQQQQLLDEQRQPGQERDRKGKGRADSHVATTQAATSSQKALPHEDLKLWEARYKEVVDTKKALESLVSSLRTQLAQMTEELESHKRAIEELRALREEDEAEIERRVSEVEDLRIQVEELGAEVHRLRGIIEESVKERREVANASQIEESLYFDQTDEGDAHTSMDVPEEQLADETARNMPNVLSPVPEEESQDPRLFDSQTFEDDQGRLSVPRASSRLSGRRSRASESNGGRVNEGKNGNDSANDEPHSPLREFRSRATAGSSGRNARRFIDVSELEHIESDIEERRSMLSNRSNTSSPDVHEVRYGVRETRATAPSLPSDQPKRSQMRSTSGSQASNAPGPSNHQAEPKSRPGSSASRKVSEYRDPFPQIRGKKMEEIFFALPDHNEATCHVCRRRRGEGKRRTASGGSAHGDGPSNRNRPSSRARVSPQNDDDPSNEDGPENEESRAELLAAANNALDRARLRRRKAEADGLGNEEDSGDDLPPQTVLARVLRELEDDFTHYKSIYLELAAQYGAMDPASNQLKRNVLAEHLKEVVDTLEQKGDQIVSLYDMLRFRGAEDGNEDGDIVLMVQKGPRPTGGAATKHRIRRERDFPINGVKRPTTVVN